MGKMKNVTLEDIPIVMRNFAGAEDKFNPPGKRNFSILLDEKQAQQMTEDGWNIKYLKVRDEGDTPQAFLKVEVSYKRRPPKICMITSRGLTYLAEDDLQMLDWVDIETADVTLNPYEYDVNGNTGVKAYAIGVYIKIVEDYLELKWQKWAEEQGALPAGSISTENLDYIDAEVLELEAA